MKRCTKYSVKLVKESAALYEVETRVSNEFIVFNYARDVLKIHEELNEICYVLYLNTKNAVIGYEKISEGGMSWSIVEPRSVFRGAMLANSANIILIHNHPSGDATPSVADDKITETLIKGGNLLGIELLDHVIIGEVPYGYRSKKSYMFQ